MVKYRKLTPQCMDDSAGPNSINSVVKSHGILRIVASERGTTLSEITDEINLSKPAVHKHLQTLVSQGYLEKDSGRYDIGYALLPISGPARDRHPLFRSARPVVDNLAEMTGELAFINILHDMMCMTFYRGRGENAVQVDTFLGTETHLHCTAAGKSILASLSDSRVEAIIDEVGLPKRTPNTITDRETLFRNLETIRERGYAFNRQERHTGMRAVGASICNRETGELIGAISVSGPINRIDDATFTEELPDLIEKNANSIEVDITFSKS